MGFRSEKELAILLVVMVCFMALQRVDVAIRRWAEANVYEISG